jgi:hypothetical protein
MMQLAKKLLSESATVSPEDKAEFLAALTEAKSALEQRNKILHATPGELSGRARRGSRTAAAKRLPQPLDSYERSRPLSMARRILTRLGARP